jgi:hypothetical protein
MSGISILAIEKYHQGRDINNAAREKAIDMPWKLCSWTSASGYQA